MRESKVEGRLTTGVKKLGGKAYKWVSPNNSGVPDRIVILPGGRIIFVETKAPGGRARALQVEVHKFLRKLECDVRVIDTVEKVDEFLREVSI